MPATPLNPRILVWLLAFFPWCDFTLRLGGPRLHLPAIVVRGWDEILLITCLIAAFAHRRGLPAVPSRISIGVTFCVGATLLAIAANRVPFAVALDAFRVMYQPMLFAVVTMLLLRTVSLTNEFIDLTIASAAAVAVGALAQYAFGIESPRWTNSPNVSQFRVVSIFANPNALAGYLNMILAFSLASTVFGGGRRRLFAALASLVMMAALVVTYSRTAWLACAVMCLVLTAMANRKYALALPLVAAVALLIAPASVVSRVAELFDPAYYRTSAEYGRLSFWSEALATLRGHLFVGVGPGMFGDSVAFRHGAPGATWVDNHYLKLGAEQGLIGLAAFLYLLFQLFRHARERYRAANTSRPRVISLAVCGVIIAASIQNVTGSVWEALYVGTCFYALIGVLLALPAEAADDGVSR